MRGKRHWYNQYNFLAPFINLKSWWKSNYKANKRAWDIIGYIVSFIILLALVYFCAPQMISEAFADKWDAEIQHELDIKAAEQRALKREQELKLEVQLSEYESHKRWNEYQRLHISQLEENKLYEKLAKKKYPIGTYISVELDGENWIGKIKTIHGPEITTTDNWHCYWGDDIKYSEIKEYKKFIDEYSKG